MKTYEQMLKDNNCIALPLEWKEYGSKLKEKWWNESDLEQLQKELKSMFNNWINTADDKDNSDEVIDDVFNNFKGK